MPLLLLLLLLVPLSTSAKDLGELSANPYQQDSMANPDGAGSPFASNGINNTFSPYGSPFSNQSATSSFAADAPRLYDQQGNYRGKLSANPYDPDSTSNPYGPYGSRFSPDSINNPYGAGSPYRSDSPTNPYGRGLRIEGHNLSRVDAELFGQFGERLIAFEGGHGHLRLEGRSRIPSLSLHRLAPLVHHL